MTTLVGDIPPDVQEEGKTRRKIRAISSSDSDDDPNEKDDANPACE